MQQSRQIPETVRDVSTSLDMTNGDPSITGLKPSVNGSMLPA
jgi:hypothetical protein